MPQLFSPVARTHERLPAPPHWSGDEEQGVFWNGHTGRVLAEVQHDGHGKFATTVYVSLLCGLRLMIERKALFLTLRPFPRIGLQLLDRRSLAAARQDAELSCQ